MNIENLKNTFKNHVEKYDMNDAAIAKKFYHSYRVMNLCKEISKDINLKEDDTNIAILIGLLHDYSRFKQWTEYKTFSDIDSIDHGDLAVEELFDNNEIKKYYENDKYYDEIYMSIKYHNKLNFPKNISERNKLFCKIIRDADKLDILYLISINFNLNKQNNELISSKIEKEFFENKLLKIEDVKNKSDRLLFDLALIYDLNFNYSFKHIKENKIIEQIYNKVEDKIKFKKYFEYIQQYIEERI